MLHGFLCDRDDPVRHSRVYEHYGEEIYQDLCSLQARYYCEVSCSVLFGYCTIAEVTD